MTVREAIRHSTSVTALGRLEVGLQGVVAAIPVPRNLDGKELYLNGDHRVLLRVVLAAVQPQQAAQTVILNILESLAEFSPFRLGFFVLNIIFNKFCHVQVRERLFELSVYPVVQLLAGGELEPAGLHGAEEIEVDLGVLGGGGVCGVMLSTPVIILMVRHSTAASQTVTIIIIVISIAHHPITFTHI